jgi:hypothetical protein
MCIVLFKLVYNLQLLTDNVSIMAQRLVSYIVYSFFFLRFLFNKLIYYKEI